MKDSVTIKFLYKTALGRFLLKGLVNPKLSVKAAGFFESKLSASIVPGFARKNNIDLSRYIVPENDFASFNDFFTRRIKDEYLLKGQGPFVSPCDGLLSVSAIDEASVFNIKNTRYNLKELLKDGDLAKEFVGGTALIFRLTPSHYHRYNFCLSGKLLDQRRIEGVLHSVQPVCHEMTDVFIQNSREYVVIENELLSKAIQMEVGALLVGKISNYPIENASMVSVDQGKGFFEYGGSSIVVLTNQPIALKDDILSREKEGTEIPVRIGEALI